LRDEDGHTLSLDGRAANETGVGTGRASGEPTGGHVASASGSAELLLDERRLEGRCLTGLPNEDGSGCHYFLAF
jgi:hypothetical protein